MVWMENLIKEADANKAKLDALMQEPQGAKEMLDAHSQTYSEKDWKLIEALRDREDVEKPETEKESLPPLPQNQPQKHRELDMDKTLEAGRRVYKAQMDETRPMWKSLKDPEHASDGEHEKDLQDEKEVEEAKDLQDEKEVEEAKGLQVKKTWEWLDDRGLENDLRRAVRGEVEEANGLQDEKDVKDDASDE